MPNVPGYVVSFARSTPGCTSQKSPSRSLPADDNLSLSVLLPATLPFYVFVAIEYILCENKNFVNIFPISLGAIFVPLLPFTADLKFNMDSSCLHVRRHIGFQIWSVEQSPHPHKQS